MAAGPWTQAELAKQLGVTFAALNRWLQGHAQPQPRRLEAIERLYKERIGFPSFTTDRIAEILTQARRLQIPQLWKLIAQNKALQDELLLEHTYNSTSIEGTTFTKRQTEGVIFNKATIPDKTLVEHLEVTNHALVLRRLLQKTVAGPITEGFIKELHKGLLHGVRDDAGFYSRHQRAIRGVELALTHPKDIHEEMEALVKEWKRKPIKKSIADIARFHVHFELIHPFGDGNGRVGRLLMVLQCLEANYPPVIIENARKLEYYEVLEYAQKKDEGPFIHFLADEMERTSKIIKKFL